MATIDDDPAITRVPAFLCPYCGHLMDTAGTTDGSAGTPAPGDICGCIACGGPMVFIDPLGTGALQLRRMTAGEADQLTDDQKQELARVQWFARHVFQPRRASRN